MIDSVEGSDAARSREPPPRLLDNERGAPGEVPADDSPIGSTPFAPPFSSAELPANHANVAEPDLLAARSHKRRKKDGRFYRRQTEHKPRPESNPSFAPFPPVRILSFFAPSRLFAANYFDHIPANRDSRPFARFAGERRFNRRGLCSRRPASGPTRKSRFASRCPRYQRWRCRGPRVFPYRRPRNP